MTSDNKENIITPFSFWDNRDVGLSIPLITTPINIQGTNESTFKSNSDSKEIILYDNFNNSDIVDYIINNNIDHKGISNIQKIKIENNIKNNYINEDTINNFILINNILHMRMNKKNYVRYDMKKYAKFINNYINESKSKYPNFNLTNKHNMIRIKNYLHNIMGIWFREKEIIEFVKEYQIIKNSL